MISGETFGPLRSVVGFIWLTLAARRYGSAVTLRNRGQLPDAFEKVRNVLELLRRPSVSRTSPSTLSLRLRAVELLDDVAIGLGQEDNSKNAMAEVLETCRLTANRHPELADAPFFKGYVARFEERLRALDAPRG